MPEWQKQPFFVLFGSISFPSFASNRQWIRIAKKQKRNSYQIAGEFPGASIESAYPTDHSSNPDLNKKHTN